MKGCSGHFESVFPRVSLLCFFGFSFMSITHALRKALLNSILTLDVHYSVFVFVISSLKSDTRNEITISPKSCLQ